MNYGQMMVAASPALVAIGGATIGYWVAENWNKLKIPRFSKDPRWKNRNQIIDFIAWSIIILGTIGIAMIGAKT
jgi:hypothetical protein